MNKLKILEEYYEKADMDSRYKESIKNLSNWILGISVGLFTITVLRLGCSCEENLTNLVYHKTLIVLTMLNLVYSGFIRHMIYTAELRLSLFDFGIKKLVLIGKSSLSKEEFEEKFTKLGMDRFSEYAKTLEIHKILNINIWSTLIVLLMFGVFILLK